jgi:hypothetical protein
MWLVDQGCLGKDTVTTELAVQGDWKMVKWCVEHGVPVCTKLWGIARQNGGPVINWLDEIHEDSWIEMY